MKKESFLLSSSNTNPHYITYTRLLCEYSYHENVQVLQCLLKYQMYKIETEKHFFLNSKYNIAPNHCQ